MRRRGGLLIGRDAQPELRPCFGRRFLRLPDKRLCAPLFVFRPDLIALWLVIYALFIVIGCHNISPSTNSRSLFLTPMALGALHRVTCPAICLITVRTWGMSRRA